MAQPEPTLTHKHLAKALGVTVTTVKSYRRKFPEFWKVASQGKPIRFSADALELCRRIRHHFKLGLSVEETRQRLAAEFEAVTPPPAPEKSKSPADEAHETHDTLARMESLMEGLFALQNRTHSLMAELVAKLDTLADHLGGNGPDPAGRQVRAPRPVAPASQAPRQADRPAVGRPAPVSPVAADSVEGGRAYRAVSGAMGAKGVSQGAARLSEGPGMESAAGLGRALAATPVEGTSGTSPAVDTPTGYGQPLDAGTGRPFQSDTPAMAPRSAAVPSSGTGARPGAASVPAVTGTRPPGDMLGMPVTVRTPEGEYLGVTLPGGRRFTLADMETYLLEPAGDGHTPETGGAAWTRSGEEWVLEAGQSGGKSLYRFHTELTPRGNTVVRLASVSVDGGELSLAALQALLRQVKESLA